MEENRVYGIYQGCIYEGGGTYGDLYYNKEDAIKEAKRIFNENIETDNKYHDDKDEFMIRHKKQYYWRECDKVKNRWHNTVDEITIVEYLIK